MQEAPLLFDDSRPEDRVGFGIAIRATDPPPF
jgi:hypothetical protein